MSIKYLRNLFRVYSGLSARKRECNQTPRVLFYHGVSEISDPFVQHLHIQPKIFVQQIEYLIKHYEIISINEYHRRFTTQTFNGREVVLTFDDGYKNNLYTLAPILQSFGLPFTVFISSSHIDTSELFPTFIGRAIVMHPALKQLTLDCISINTPLKGLRQRKKVFKILNRHLKHEPMEKVRLITQQLINHISAEAYSELREKYTSDIPMNWEEVRQLLNTYDCTIGSHCLDHFICGTFQDAEEMIRQIKESKHRIEQQTGITCCYFAYPNGDCCDIALQAVREAGYKMAFTTNNYRINNESPLMALPRYGVNFNSNAFKTDMAFKPK